MSNSERERAQRIRDTLGTAGWRDISTMLAEQETEPPEELYAIIGRRTDTLTGKSAVRLAARSAALKDFRESIEDTQKLLLDNRPQLVRAGQE